MRTLLVLVEERSAEEFLRGFLPRVLPDDVDIQFRVFEGKQDLDRRLVVQIREWRRPDTLFVVLRDQDSLDCVELKRLLVEKCRQAGRDDALVRIACRELEAWYLGDLRSVESALELTGLQRHQNSRRFRQPDSVVQPANALRELTRKRYQKVSGSRAIGEIVSPDGNLSRSFQVFVNGVRQLVGVDG